MSHSFETKRYLLKLTEKMFERMIIAFTLGFDEKFAVRALIRHRVSGDDRVVVITPKAEFDQRAERALNSLNEFVRKYLSSQGVAVFQVDVSNFANAVAELVDMYRSWAGEEIILNLSGGMRALILEALVAAIMSKVEMRVEVESEDGSFLIDFEISVVDLAKVDRVEQAILRVLSEVEVASISQLAEIVGISKSTVWRRVKRLARLNLIERLVGRPGGGRPRLVLTERGRLFLGLRGEEG